MDAGRRSILIVVLIGAAIGGAAADYFYRTRGAAVTGAQGVDLQMMQADVTHLKELIPTQSHAMRDVADHWSNLYFAAKAGNWPLAKFFFSEARQYVRWAVLIRPGRRATPETDNKDVDVKSIWDAIEPTTFAAVDVSLDVEDFAEFEKEYKVALESCYSCHKAAGLPHLRPMVPTTPPLSIINFDPKATWP
jgi:hypothetical protein